AVRRSVEAAAQQQAEREAKAAVAAAHPGLLSRVRGVHVAIAACVPVVAIVVALAWPDPAAKRVLVAYLESCDEAAVAPDASLALASLGLAVREFGDITLLPSARLDYSEELAAFARQGDLADDWWELLATVPMSDAKYDALVLLVGAFPEGLTPRKIGGLQATEQPAVCRMVSRQRGMSMLSDGRYRFVLLKASSPTWRCDWKVAACELAAVVK
ncbi:MAG TPA: hypothetical protein VNE39_15650, partial [Planctomycetota bacterium]|nr:hypothetical protein [Planctomycetota bacterium]